MKKFTLIIFLSFICSAVFAQQRRSTHFIDSLKHELAAAKLDTDRVIIIAKLCDQFQNNDFDSLQVYSKSGLALAQRIKFPGGGIKIMCYLAFGLQLQGDIPKSLDLLFKALQISEEAHLKSQTVLCLNYIGNAYWFLNDFPKAIIFYKKAGQLNKTIPNSPEKINSNTDLTLNIALSYLSLNRLDSAKIYLNKVDKQLVTNDYDHSYFLLLYGNLLFKLGDHKTAFSYLRQSIAISDKTDENYVNGDACYFLAGFFKETRQRDSCIFYAKKGLENSQKINYKSGILENSKLLAEQYENKDINKAHYYLKLVMAVNEELFGSNKVKELQKTLSDEQERQRKIEAGRVAYQNQLKQYAFLAGLGILLLIAFILYRNNQREKKGKKLLEEKNEVIEKTLSDLKATQTQLIQSEKMASLGELTAGIAHEIQNPLNFINNFSDVNHEMLEELQAESRKPKAERDEHLEIELINDLIENEKKINHHGKRADGIVKGMLQHSRASSNVKELTDINKLADEYLRLAYHGLRAKDKSFNAELTTSFAAELPKMNTVPQDIGRVLLNLFTNAFYATQQKKKEGAEDYKPMVAVITSVNGKFIRIKVKDNGIGIPDNIKDKILQPFFTTKPTGEGTGLGLSLSYDTVVKGHGGKINIESKEGEGSEFIIDLPLQ
jgi:two-component system, NtrC family, sensor kinase